MPGHRFNGFAPPVRVHTLAVALAVLLLHMPKRGLGEGAAAIQLPGAAAAKRHWTQHGPRAGALSCRGSPDLLFALAPGHVGPRKDGHSLSSCKPTSPRPPSVCQSSLHFNRGQLPAGFGGGRICRGDLVALNIAFKGAVPRSWSVEKSSPPKKSKDVEYDARFCTYRGVRWPRAMLKFMVEEVGIPSSRITYLAVETPQVIALNVETNLRPKLEFLLGEVGISKSDIGKVVGKHPMLFALSLSQNLKPTVRYLQEEVLLQREGGGVLAKLVACYPQVLGLNMENNIGPKLKFLREEVGISAEEIATIVRRNPSTLGRGLSSHIQPLVLFLSVKLGIPTAQIGRMFVKCPRLLTAPLNACVKGVPPALCKELRMTRAQVRDMAERYPSILTLSPQENVRPFVRLLVGEYKVPKARIVRMLMKRPSALSMKASRVQQAVRLLVDAGLGEREAISAALESPRALSSEVASRMRPSLETLDAMLHAREGSTDRAVSSAKSRRKRLARAVAKSPGVLGMDVEGNMGAVESMLRGPMCGLSRKEVAAVVSRFPGILGISAERKIGPALEWIAAPITEGGLGATPKQAAKMTLNSPQLYGLSLNETLKLRVEYLHSSVGIPWESMAGVLSKAPSLLTFPPRAIGENLDYLQLELGMRPEIAARTVIRCPSILLASLPRKVRPIVSYLTDEIGVPPTKLASMLAAHPQVVMSSFDEKIRPTISWLTISLNLTNAEVAKVLAAQPCILSFSLTDNLMPKFNFIQSRLGTTRQEFGKMVAKFPALLTLSIDKNLAPKLDLLLEEASVPAETLIRSPQLLGYSLENRILPRCSALLSVGMLIGRGLAGILAPTDEVFERRFGTIVEVEIDLDDSASTDDEDVAVDKDGRKFLDPGIAFDF